MISRFGEEVEMIIEGCYGPCIGIHAILIVEAMLVIVLMNHFVRQRA